MSLLKEAPISLIGLSPLFSPLSLSVFCLLCKCREAPSPWYNFPFFWANIVASLSVSVTKGLSIIQHMDLEKAARQQAGDRPTHTASQNTQRQPMAVCGLLLSQAG